MDPKAIKLPVINFSHIKENTSQWESVRDQVERAFEQYGSFLATYDDVPHSLLKTTMNDSKQLFDLPLEVKWRNKTDEPFVGYLGNNSKVPFYESLGIKDALSAVSVEEFTNLMWPEGNSTFGKSIQLYSERLSGLDKIVRRMVLESLGLEKYTDEHMDSSRYVVRVQKYAVPKSYCGDSKNLVLPQHTDKNYVTILHQNEVNGLEVMTRDGQWITVDPPSDNSFIVLIGDAFHAWTNGRLISPTRHRVTVACDRARYSIGFFSSPKSGYVVKAPDEMVDEEHPLLFKPFDYSEFVKFYQSLSEAGDKNRYDALKEYCGAQI